VKVIVAGSRNIFDREFVYQSIANSGFNVTEVVSGGQVTKNENGEPVGGVDWLGECWAKDHGIPIKQFPADWAQHGGYAGILRNMEMGQTMILMCILIAVCDRRHK